MDSAALQIIQGMVQYVLRTVVSRSIAGKAGEKPWNDIHRDGIRHYFELRIRNWLKCATRVSPQTAGPCNMQLSIAMSSGSWRPVGLALALPLQIQAVRLLRNEPSRRNSNVGNSIG